MLQEVKHIEGYVGFEEADEMLDDTNPGSVQVRFDVKAEEMPAESEKMGQIVRRNFIHITCVWELGRTSFTRRIRDKVQFNDKTGKWEILKFAPGPLSDIRTWSKEWNAFMQGAAEQEVGIPLQFLFKNDPSRVEFYKSRRITTIDRLAGLNDSDADMLGMGGRDDVQRARAFMKRTKESAPAIELNNRLEEKDFQIKKLEERLADYEAKLTELLTAQLEGEPAKKRGRPRKVTEETENA